MEIKRNTTSFFVAYFKIIKFDLMEVLCILKCMIKYYFCWTYTHIRFISWNYLTERSFELWRRQLIWNWEIFNWLQRLFNKPRSFITIKIVIILINFYWKKFQDMWMLHLSFKFFSSFHLVWKLMCTL